MKNITRSGWNDIVKYYYHKRHYGLVFLCAMLKFLRVLSEPERSKKLRSDLYVMF